MSSASAFLTARPLTAGLPHSLTRNRSPRSLGRFTMSTATWNGVVVADSDKFETVEGNVYFPKSSIKSEYFKKSSTTTVCPWKGTANYYTLNVNGKENPDAAWFYENPKPAAANIKDHVAFWKGVQVSK